MAPHPRASVLTPSDESAVRRLQATRLVVTGSAALVLFGAWALWRDPVPLALSLLAAVSSVHASVGAFRRPVSVPAGLVMDTAALLVGIAALRPPPGSVIGLTVYGALAALVFASRRTALLVAIGLSSGAALVMGVAHVLAPRTWSGGPALAIVGLSIAVSTWAVLWLMRIVADGLIERASVVARLAESEAAHRRVARDLGLVLDTAAEGIYGVDADGVCTFASQAVADILGHRPEDLVGRDMHDAIHRLKPDGSPYPKEECSIGLPDLKDGYTSDDEVYVAADGSLVPVSVSSRAIVQPDGVISGAVVSFRPMADQIEAMRQLRLQAVLLHHVGAAVVVMDLDGRVSSWNRRATDMYGWEAAEAVGRSIVDLVVPVEGAADAEDAMRQIAEHGSWQGEIFVRRRDGSTFPVLTTSVLLRDEDGAPTGILEVGIDVTEQHRLAAHAKRQGDLAAGVLDAVDFPMCVLDGDSVILAVNEAWRDFAAENGGTPEATGPGVRYLDVARPEADDEDARAAAAGILGVLEGREAGFELEYPCHGPDRERWFRMVVTPLDGIGAVVAHWDTTAEWRARVALEDAVASKDRFLAIVSHEFRTPLTVVLGLAEELRDGEFDHGEIGEFHRMIADQARDMSHLVDDVLVATRSAAGSMGLERVEVHLGEQVAAVLEPLLADFATGVEVDGPALDVTVLADAARLRQVLRNLFTNAFRHGSAPVRVTAVTGADTVALEVVDHGAGVPPEIVDSLFEPYTALPSAGLAAQSIGLGLFVSRQLVHLMDGEVSYRRRGDTTVFTLVLPVADRSPTEGHDRAGESVIGR